MKRDNIETFRLPFVLDEVLEELRMLIWCTASQVALLGRTDLAVAMIEPGAEIDMMDDASAHLSKIDLDSFDITGTVREGFDFAFQVNDPGRFSADDWADLMGLVSGSVHNAWTGEVSPLWQEGSKLRHVGDMVHGRISLLTGNALSIRELALLANMVEPAVRSSLSAEGIKTEGRPASLSAETALAWLRGRRGFVPTRDGRAVQHLASGEAVLNVRPFPEALLHMIESTGEGRDGIVARHDLDPALMDRLTSGTEMNAGTQDLVRIAQALVVEPQQLIAAYVRFVCPMS